MLPRLLLLSSLAAAVLSAGSPAFAQGRTYESEGGTVRAKDGEQVLWENRHDLAEVVVSERTPLVGPLLSGDSLWYAIGVQLYQADAASGAIRTRTYLPAPPARLEGAGGGVRVTVKGELETSPWERTWVVGTHGSGVPFSLPGNLINARLIRSDAEQAAREAVGREQTRLTPADLAGVAPAQLDAAVQALSERAAWDPTNPWYDHWRGHCLWAAGKKDEARAAWKACLSIEGPARIELLAMVLRLDELDRDIADATFEVAMRAYHDLGLEPELNQILISLMMFYGNPRDALRQGDPQANIEELLVIGQRLADLAPRGEAVCTAFSALADHCRANPNYADQAPKWEALARAAEPYRFFGGANNHGQLSGHALTLVVAAVIAFIACLVIKLTRILTPFKASEDAGSGRLLVFRFWTRGEILGMLALLAVIAWGTFAAARGIGAIGVAAGQPLSLLNGSLGHPDGVAFWKRKAKGPEGEFIYALALQQSGNHDRAKAIYLTLPFAEAQVNLGVIAAEAGDEDAARRHYEAALRADPGLAPAAFNLGQAVDTPRAQRFQKYGVTRPMSALPTADMWSEAYADASPGGAGLSSLFSLSDGGSPPVSAVGTLVQGVLVVCACLLLVCLVLPPLGAGRAHRSPSSMLAWSAGVLFPGSSQHWSALGPLVLTAVLASAQVAYLVSTSGATNLIEAIAIPNVVQAFGVPAPANSGLPIGPFSEQVAGMGNLWWLLWLMNVAVIAVGEKLSPDPGGPNGRFVGEVDGSSPPEK